MILMVIKSSKIKAPRQGSYDSNVGLYGYKTTERPYDRRDQSSLASDAQTTINKIDLYLKSYFLLSCAIAV